MSIMAVLDNTNYTRIALYWATNRPTKIITQCFFHQPNAMTGSSIEVLVIMRSAGKRCVEMLQVNERQSQRVMCFSQQVACHHQKHMNIKTGDTVKGLH
jgi:hypothetical protein